MLRAQRVELFGQLLAVGRGQLSQFKACLGLGLVGPTAFDEQFRHFVGPDLVELVDLAQNALDVGEAETTVEAFGKLAVVRVHGGLRQAERTKALQRRHHDQRQFDLVVVGQVAVADHIDVRLHELAETPLLRTLATPDLLDLPPFEREGQIARMFDDVPAQRNGEIEMQTQAVLNRSVGLVTDLLQAAQQINLLAGLAFLEQARTLLDSASFNAYEAIELENITERVDDTLLHNTFRGEPLWKS